MTDKELKHDETEYQKLVYQVQHDELLDIFNRRYAKEYLRDAAGVWTCASFILIDIEGFKSINATYGHEFADEILIHTALKLKALAIENKWILSRHGGDQFLIMCNKTLTEDHLYLKLIREVFEEPFRAGSIEFKVSVSIGVANANSALELEEQVDNAEEAMRIAKSLGHNKTFFTAKNCSKKPLRKKKFARSLEKHSTMTVFIWYISPKLMRKTSRYRVLKL